MPARRIHCRQVLLPQGWRQDVVLELDTAGMVEAVRDNPGDSCDTVLKGPVIPGMPNLHSHGFQALIAGLTGRGSGSDDSFWTWRTAMYRMAERIDPDSLARCMGGVYLHMLRNGYTSCAEFHYLHHAPGGQPYKNPAELSQRVVAAAQATGIGLTLLPVLYCRSGFGAAQVEPQQRRFAHSADSYLDLLQRCADLLRDQPGSRLGIAPHSLRAVGKAALEQVLAAADQDCPVHIHIAEQPREVSDCLVELGARPVEWLLDHFEVGSRWCLVHATHANRGERERAAGAGAVAGLCPTTEADLGDGIFDAAHWLEAGGKFGIGSDSNLRLSVSEELRWLEFGQRLASGRRNVLADNERSCGRLLYESAADGGARALGQPAGRLAAGFRADLVELDGTDPRLAGLHGDDVLDAYLFAGGGSMIRSVWVAGQPLIEHGRHPRQEQLEAGFARVMKELRS